MPEIRITLIREFPLEAKISTIQQRFDDLKDCKIIKSEIEQVYEKIGVTEYVKKVTWIGFNEQRDILETADYFVITFEILNHA